MDRCHGSCQNLATQKFCTLRLLPPLPSLPPSISPVSSAIPPLLPPPLLPSLNLMYVHFDEGDPLKLTVLLKRLQYAAAHRLGGPLSVDPTKVRGRGELVMGG